MDGAENTLKGLWCLSLERDTSAVALSLRLSLIALLWTHRTGHCIGTQL